MAYEIVGMCLSENLQKLDLSPRTPENRALYNLSNALLNMCAAVEADLAAIHNEIAVLRTQLHKR